MSKKVYAFNITQLSVQLLRYSDWVKGLTIDGRWLDSWYEQDISLFSKLLNQALGSKQQPSQRIFRQVPEASHTPQSSA